MQMLKYWKIFLLKSFQKVLELRPSYNLYDRKQGDTYLGRKPQDSVMKNQYKLTTESSASSRTQ